MGSRITEALAIVKDLAETPNGAPTWIHDWPLRDPLGNVMKNVDGTQCLLCYKSVRGRKDRHTKDCPWIRAKKLFRASRKKRKGEK